MPCLVNELANRAGRETTKQILKRIRRRATKDGEAHQRIGSVLALIREAEYGERCQLAKRKRKLATKSNCSTPEALAFFRLELDVDVCAGPGLTCALALIDNIEAAPVESPDQLGEDGLSGC
jgi:hypothetical protein